MSRESNEPGIGLKSTSEEILNEHGLVASQKFFSDLFSEITGVGAVLNRNRQIIYVNNDFLGMLGLTSIETILGKRPGEAILCIHAKNPNSCGNSPSCRFCGAYNAIFESQKTGSKVVREAFITTKVNGKLNSMDLKVICTPVILSGHTFFALIIQDISHEKRRQALEKIFFHDLLNTAGGLNGLLSLLKDGTAPKVEKHIIDLSEQASREMIEEIQMHRQILAAETGDLHVDITRVNTARIIETVITKIRFHWSCKNKEVLKEPEIDVDFETDSIILQRVLMNLLKNALEATPENGSVSIGAVHVNNKIRFNVRNGSLIPEHVKLQVFQRSFSTKGAGRGLGTYSVRLLTENYLKGLVSFISDEVNGTIFSIDLEEKYPPE